MAIIAIYDDGGTSKLLDVEFRLEETDTFRWSGPQPAAHWVVIDGAPAGAKDWHTAGSAGLSVVIEGSWEIEAGDGSRRKLERGDVLVLLDTTGQGHRSRVTGDRRCVVLGVSCAPAADDVLWELVRRARAAAALKETA
jgi:hypothetical protein